MKAPRELVKDVDKYEDHEITEVRIHNDDEGKPASVSMGFAGMGFGYILADANPEAPMPKVGDTARLYGERFGIVRGLDINGAEVYYRTPAEQQAKDRVEREKRQAEKRAEFEAKREEMDARVAALPECFQRRLDKFRYNNPDFRWEYESYELMCLEEAVRIADKLGSPEAVNAWRQAGYAEQKRLVPGIEEGHSGNSIGFAGLMAELYAARNEEAIIAWHGALAPLVGSKEYGCVPREETDG